MFQVKYVCMILMIVIKLISIGCIERLAVAKIISDSFSSSLKWIVISSIQYRLWYLARYDKTAFLTERIQSIVSLINVVENCWKQHSVNEGSCFTCHFVIINWRSDNDDIRFMKFQ